MRKMIQLLLPAALFVGCGSDSTNNPPTGIVVTVQPNRVVVDFGDTAHFVAYVQGTDIAAVTWCVNGVVGGDSIYGRIDATGNYVAPAAEPPDADSAAVEARSAADSTRSGRAWAVMIDPSMIFVDSFIGSDSTGIGTQHRPYKSITKALSRALSGHQIFVAAGEYNTASGERFPLIIPPGVMLMGAGMDSTFITGPGGLDPFRDALVRVHGDAITVEGVHVRSSLINGVGFWLRPGYFTRIVDSRVSNSVIGIFANGPGGQGTPRSSVISVRLDSDSIGIVTADTCALLIRNSTIANCYSRGIDIRDLSRPDLGINDSTGAGRNRIDSCGIGDQWLIYNGTVNTIMAVGNTLPYATPSFNDPLIYDDEESGGASGAVILENQ